MKNITVSVPDDVYRDAKIRAAERGSSVSALVGDYLCSLSNREAERARLNAKRREIISRIGYFSASENISRDELYERGRRAPQSPRAT